MGADSGRVLNFSVSGGTAPDRTGQATGAAARVPADVAGGTGLPTADYRRPRFI
jgi:hypothetical protein